MAIVSLKELKPTISDCESHQDRETGLLRLFGFIFLTFLIGACGKGPLRSDGIQENLSEEEQIAQHSQTDSLTRLSLDQHFMPAGYLMIGDMILHRSRLEETSTGEKDSDQFDSENDRFRSSGFAFADENQGTQITDEMWPDGVLPIAFATDVSLEKRQFFLSKCGELTDFARVKCVTLPDVLDPGDIQLYTGNNLPQIIVVDTESRRTFACGSSFVGYTGYSYQIKIGCWNDRTVRHELLHALGFEHEHNRPDRDYFVDIDYRNLDPFTEAQYRKSKTALFLSEDYDFDSIMHYGTIQDRGKFGYTLLRHEEVYVEPNSCDGAGSGYPSSICLSGGFTRFVPYKTELSDTDRETLIALYGANEPQFIQISNFSQLIDISSVTRFVDGSIELSDVYDRRQPAQVRIEKTQLTVLSPSLDRSRKLIIQDVVGRSQSLIMNNVNSMVLF